MYRGAIFTLDGVLLNINKTGLENIWAEENGLRIDKRDLLPGGLELLKVLREKGIKVALCSLGRGTHTILERLQINDYFEAVVDKAQFEGAQGDARLFLLAAEKLGLEPWDCAAFEAVETGIISAKQAGMYTIGVGAPELKATADLYLYDLFQCNHEQLFADRRWCLYEDQFNLKFNRHYEGAFTTGNGYLSVRGSLEEGLTDDPQDEEYLREPANVTLEEFRPGKSKWGTFIPGMVGRHPLLNHEIINLPWFLEFIIYIDGEKLDLEQGKITNYCRYLNMRDGTLNRGFQWETKTGVRCALGFIRFVSMKTPGLAVQRIWIKSLNGCGDLRIESGINSGVRTNGFNHFTRVDTGVTEDGFIYTEVITDQGNQLLEVSSIRHPDRFSCRSIQEGGRIYFRGDTLIRPGEILEFIKLTSLATDRDLEPGEFRERAIRTIKTGIASGFSKLYREHSAIWKQNWDASDIVIEGDEKAQLALRFSIYHLIRSNAGQDPRVGICSKGYAGEGYFGRYFWDNEIYLLPFFIYTNPEAARNLVLFRYHTLNGARENALKYGYKGARYAWESAVSGREEGACWQYTDHEIHITADVIYALWHYFRQTEDFRFMEQYGLEMLVETARYWIDRVDYKKETGKYALLGVMGPDEYLPFTKNNAYTNAMVKFSLEKTLTMLTFLALNHPQSYQRLSQRLKLTEEEIAKFAEIMSGLTIPFDPATNLVLQSEDFEEYNDLNFEEIWKERHLPFGRFISQEKNYRSKALKQADVLLLMFLLPDLFTMEQIKQAYAYYEPLTTHDSSLSYSIHAIIAAWIGKMSDAAYFFKKAAEIDLNPEKLGCEEGIHIANAGGIWQAVVHGFAGIKNATQSEFLEINPRLPPSWSKLEFPFIWRGHKVRIIIGRNFIEVVNKGDSELQLKTGGILYGIKPGNVITVTYPAFDETNI
ncbi:MAG: HAD family hydrolase [Bacillota bacterium]